MKPGPRQPLDPEETNLVSALVIFVGILVLIVGAHFAYTLADGDPMFLVRSIMLLWGGAAGIVAGFAIRRNKVIMLAPRWGYAGFLIGVVSAGALAKTTATDDVVGALALLPMQVFAIYALWRGCWR